MDTNFEKGFLKTAARFRSVAGGTVKFFLPVGAAAMGIGMLKNKLSRNKKRQKN